MEENDEILNFNEILFQPSQEIICASANPPRTPPKPPKSQANNISTKSPRQMTQKQKKQTAQNIDSMLSTTGNPKVRRDMLSPHLQNSPLLSGPFQIRPPENSLRTPRTVHRSSRSSTAREYVNQSSKGNFAPPIVNPYASPNSARSCQRNSDSGTLLYTQRSRILTANRQNFFRDLSHKYSNRANMTPYGMDMTVYRNVALRKSEQNRKEEQMEDMMETAATSRMKSQARKNEVENDKRFTKDYIINKNYPELRMIPVRDRIDRAGDETVVFI